MCGVGFIARVDGAATRSIVSDGLLALRRVAHRGALDALGSVDGCVITAIPWRHLERDVQLPTGRSRGLGMLFVQSGGPCPPDRQSGGPCPADRHGNHRAEAIAIVERELRVAGAIGVVWREVPRPTSASALRYDPPPWPVLTVNQTGV